MGKTYMEPGTIGNIYSTDSEKPLRANLTRANLLASVSETVESDRSGIESNSHLQTLSTNWHQRQPLSGPKANIVLAVSVTGIVHSFSHVKQLSARVNAGRLIIKRLGRSHQEQRNQCDDSSERCIRFSSGEGFFWSFPLGKPLLKLN